MFDLISTDATTDRESANCARLLAAVIAQAIDDASTMPTTVERGNKRNSPVAASALHFLFGDNPMFERYATLIGADPVAMREALTSKTIKLNTAKGARFSEHDRRCLQFRLHLERSSGALQYA